MFHVLFCETFHFALVTMIQNLVKTKELRRNVYLSIYDMSSPEFEDEVETPQYVNQ